MNFTMVDGHQVVGFCVDTVDGGRRVGVVSRLLKLENGQQQIPPE